MTILSTALNSLGLILLTHAVYSAHEHSSLYTSHTSVPTTTSSPSARLPLDITIELLASVLIVCVGVVLAAPDLKPIQWSVWAGKVEREEGRKKGKEGEDVNPFRMLEERTSFLDVRAKRKQFADWVREGAKG